MNLSDSSFLCLDIGTSGVRGIAHRVRSGRLAKSSAYSIDSFDTVFAIKSVVDELERQIGDHFETAYITGNFGQSVFKISKQTKVWRGEHKVTQSDMMGIFSKIASPADHNPLHVIPLKYLAPNTKRIRNPINCTDYALTAIFGIIFYSVDAVDKMVSTLHAAHIQPQSFYDPTYLQYCEMHTEKSTELYIDFGAEYTSFSIWRDNGPIFFQKIKFGGTDITREISKQLNISFEDAERIKRNVASMMPKDMDRFTPADPIYDFSRADINNIILPMMVDLCARIKDSCANLFQRKFPNKIIISGGGSEMDYISDFVENVFGIPVRNARRNANIDCLSAYIWNSESSHRDAYTARSNRIHNVLNRITSVFNHKKAPKPKFIPILPSTLCFDMEAPSTYTMFESAGISMIHVDIMDGLYVENIRGGIPELKYIRNHTRAHLHVHLMTESPELWAVDAIAAGANTIIISTSTAGVRTALQQIRASGRRAGIALNPNSSVKILKNILRDIDEVMIMAVAPGAAGQEFDERALRKISILDATRKKRGLKFNISVDGGINNETAKKCWAAGADYLVSGSYLAKSADFPLAVQSLLKRN